MHANVRVLRIKMMLPHCKDEPQQSHLGFLYRQHQETDPCSVMKLLFQTWG